MTNRPHTIRYFVCNICRTDWEVYEDWEDYNSEPAEQCPECGELGTLTDETIIQPNGSAQ